MTKGSISASETSVLDFAPKCSCGNHAIAYLEIHAVDYCVPGQQTWAKLLCKPCLMRDVLRAVNVVLDGPTFCGTCQLPIVTLSDMVVRLCPLTAMGV